MIITRTIVVEGDGLALDALLFETYGREDLVPLALDANPGLAALGPILPAGTVIRMPDPPAIVAEPAEMPVSLWSEP